MRMPNDGVRTLSVNDNVVIEPDRIVITARCRAAASECPDCRQQSGRVHSRDERRLLDLPSHGRTVQLRVAVRRFRCAEPSCRRGIFAERLDETVDGRSARCTFRLEAIVHHLGVAVGGRPAATLARRLMLPVSKDTLLRVGPLAACLRLLVRASPRCRSRSPDATLVERPDGRSDHQAQTRAAPARPSVNLDEKVSPPCKGALAGGRGAPGAIRPVSR
jgi:zinc-finger of transposase IS204/IS1001/IS1096/IS1165